MIIRENKIYHPLPVYEVREVSVKEALVLLKSDHKGDIDPLIANASRHLCLSGSLLDDYKAWINSV